jgi:hypothetical protein
VRSAVFAMSSLRRLARTATSLVAMLVVLAPAGLGPSAGAIARALGIFDHACACGMAPGKCGCPACERLERERNRQGPRPVLESNCERSGALVPVSAVPPCILPGALALDAPAAAELPSLRPPTPPHLANTDGPATPPPRV